VKNQPLIEELLREIKPTKKSFVKRTEEILKKSSKKL